VDYVDVLTAIVGAAISRSMREAELVHLAFHDGLTEVFNRRGLEVAAAEVFVPPDEGLRVVTVVVVDLDGLKQVNDRHGHARGDELLSAAASALEQAFLPLAGSVVARVGGDEFVVLVPDHDPDLVIAIVQALCEAAGTGWGFGPEAGASAGVACVLLDDRAGATFPELLEVADRALYEAKRHGTPDVVVATDLMPRPRDGGQQPSVCT
jgi:diguanylate cyclase (GGDEF)-like protein